MWLPSRVAGGTINLHSSRDQTLPKLFLANPWAIDFERASGEGYVVSAASDVLVKISLDDNGVPSVVSVPAEGDTTRVLTIAVGQNPRGVAVNNADTRAYVTNYISKDVSVVDLTQAPEVEIARLESAAPPAAGSDAERFLLGNYLFNTSRGSLTKAAERMSSEGWPVQAAIRMG
jgi:DNA-binding beta-propeller fold protein YncE